MLSTSFPAFPHMYSVAKPRAFLRGAIPLQKGLLLLYGNAVPLANAKPKSHARVARASPAGCDPAYRLQQNCEHLYSAAARGQGISRGHPSCGPLYYNKTVSIFTCPPRESATQKTPFSPPSPKPRPRSCACAWSRAWSRAPRRYFCPGMPHEKLSIICLPSASSFLTRALPHPSSLAITSTTCGSAASAPLVSRNTSRDLRARKSIAVTQYSCSMQYTISASMNGYPATSRVPSPFSASSATLYAWSPYARARCLAHSTSSCGRATAVRAVSPLDPISYRCVRNVKYDSSHLCPPTSCTNGVLHRVAFSCSPPTSIALSTAASPIARCVVHLPPVIVTTFSGDTCTACSRRMFCVFPASASGFTASGRIPDHALCTSDARTSIRR
ncbi:unnamed protein product [Chondrus crispus]|uniref:Uncharacterized protein n=1 Tax=Chondrus crispus TaxID=2769 RepID=R7QPY7_CHOCR|nr:unnamed protein product [Chondrus crispus]CDF40547.1 unnamed protein product [Chondrus crispus]|eukprot:XP_005710841.1 unnamed protein product [Chondrus crispus]